MVHKRMHTVERPHECDACGQRFINLKESGIHLRSHPTFKCTECKACFTRKERLIEHTSKYCFSRK